MHDLIPDVLGCERVFLFRSDVIRAYDDETLLKFGSLLP